MSDQTTPPSTPSGTRTTPAPPPAAKKKAPSKAAKLIGGAAAAAAAVAATVVYGDDIADAAGGDVDGDAGTGPIGTPLAEATATGGPTGTTTTAGPTGTTQEAAPRRTRQANADADDAPAGQSAGTTSQPAAAAAAAPTAAAPPAVDADFEAARATLLERLDNFQAPAGTSPEDAAQLRQDLIDAVERFTPSPGQSTEDALAELRDNYDEQVEDFTRDQKLDALIEEAQRDNEAEAAAQAAVDAPVAGDPDIDPTAGQIDPTAGQIDPRAGQLDPTKILVGLDQPSAEAVLSVGGLKDDFELLIADVPPGATGGVVTPLASQFAVAGVVIPADLQQQQQVDDVLGQMAVAQMVVPLEALEPIPLAGEPGFVPVVLEVAEFVVAPIDLGADTELIVGPQDGHLVNATEVWLATSSVGEESVDQMSVPQSDDRFAEDEEVDFAADLARDITPETPTTHAFEP